MNEIVGEKERVRKLIRKVRETENSEEREKAVRALGYMREKATDAVPDLVIVLQKDEHWLTRGAAALALGRIKDKSVIDVLINAMKEDENWRVRLNAAWALGEMDTERALEPMKEIMQEERNRYGKFYIAYSLAVIEGKRNGEGIKIIKEMREKGELEDWEIDEFNTLYQELELQERIDEVEEEFKSVRDSAKAQPESKEKEVLLNDVSSLNRTINQLTKEFKELRKVMIERKEKIIHPKQVPCFKMDEPKCYKDIEVQPKQVFNAMPFREKFFDIYEKAIKPCLSLKGFVPVKADDEPKSMDLMCLICKLIRESKWSIVNITDWNANVMFELGLLWGFGKKVILIKDRESKVPADLRGMTYVNYDYNSLDDFIKELGRTIETNFKE